MKNPARSATVAATLSVNTPHMPIYTRTGDDGTTSLFGGKRVLKCEDLVDVYGSIDELNSWMGLIVSELTIGHLKKLLLDIQSDLLIIGSNLAGWKTDLSPLTTRARRMEKTIDDLERDLPKLTNFILPGGNTEASRVHIARSVCRRVERQVVAVSQKEHVDPIIAKYLNRLSDLFFMLARFINKQGKVRETVWSGIPRK